MELFLGAEEALLIVTEAEEYPEEGDDTETNSWNKRIAKGAAMINAACHISVKPYIRHITDARKMWKTLAEKLDTTATRAGRCSLLRQFHALRPTTSNKSPFGVTEYINQLAEFSNRLEGSDQRISDETFIAHLTTTLPETFRNIIDIILHQPSTEQTLPKVISTLIEWEQSEETRRTASQLNNSSSSLVPAIAAALNAEGKTDSPFGNHVRYGSSSNRVGFNRSRARVGKFNPKFQHNRPRPGLGFKGRSQRECWYCSKVGHVQKDCFKKRNQRHWSNDRKAESSLLSILSNRTAQANLAVVHALTANGVKTTVQQSHVSDADTSQQSFNLEVNQRWIIDSGVSHTLTPDKELFTFLNPLAEEIAVTVGNGATIKAVGSGTVSLQFSCGLIMSIEALYVPGIHRSLLSVGQLNNHIPLTFRNGYCYGGSIAIGILQNGL